MHCRHVVATVSIPKPQKYYGIIGATSRHPLCLHDSAKSIWHRFLIYGRHEIWNSVNFSFLWCQVWPPGGDLSALSPFLWVQTKCKWREITTVMVTPCNVSCCTAAIFVLHQEFSATYFWAHMSTQVDWSQVSFCEKFEMNSCLITASYFSTFRYTWKEQTNKQNYRLLSFCGSTQVDFRD